MSTANPDAELVARGERFEKLLLEHMDAWLTWAPRMRAARAEVEDNTASLAVAIQRTGCDMVQVRMSEIERDMQPLAEEIIAAPATSLGGLRAKALVALWEAYPTHASHEGTFEFRDDGSRSLFEAVAVMTGLSPLVRELEARLAADADSCRGRARSESPAQTESKPRRSARSANSSSGAACGCPAMMRSRVGSKYPMRMDMTFSAPL